jgi:succinate dehydrogenase/fumarate reductase cytochrome b subunit
MNAKELVAPVDPYGLPAPVWVFVLLLNVTLVLHFIAMGYVLTTTLLHIPWSLAARPGNTAEWMLRRTEGPLPVALSFTITLGVAPLLFVQVLYQPVFYTANILIGYQWIGVIGVLMAGFYLIYLLWGGKCLGREIPRGVQAMGRLLIFASILYVGLTMTVNALIGLRPEQWPAIRASSGLSLLHDEPLFWPRLLHNLLAAVVIGGVWMVALGSRSERVESEETARTGGTQLRKLGAVLVMSATFLEMAIGVWLLVVAEKDVQSMLFSGRPAAILWMTSLLGVAALLMLGVWTLIKRPGAGILAVWGVLALVLGGMFAGRQAAREVRLAPYLNLHEDWVVRPQIGSLALFLVLFVVALGIVGLMAKWLVEGWRGKDTKGPTL